MITRPTGAGGHVYLLDNDVEVELGRAINHGRQGTIREVVGEPALVAKVLASDHRAAGRIARHLETDARSWLDDRGSPLLAWPIARLTARDDTGSGFLMVRFDASWLQLEDVLRSRDRASLGIRRTWRDLVGTATRLAELVDRVNGSGLIVGDLSARNVLVSDAGAVAFVDCDDMLWADDTSGDAPQPLTTEDYGAWELHRSPPARVSFQTDAWALAVMIIQILQDGAHPFAGSGGEHPAPRGILPNLDEGRTRFASGAGRRFVLSADEPSWLPIETLPPELLALARACLLDGRTAPEMRPSAADWVGELRRLQFAECAEHPGHVFSAHLSSCPWCEHVGRGQRDPFGEIRGTLR